MADGQKAGQQQSLTAEDHVSVREWWRDLQYKEVHLFTLGFYSGFVAVRPKARAAPKVDGAKANPWYWKGGYVLGYLTKVAVVTGVGVQKIVPML